MAEVMKREYDAIVQAGFLLQLDCPDLALRSTWFPDLSIPEFRTVVAQNIAALTLPPVIFHRSASVCTCAGSR